MLSTLALLAVASVSAEDCEAYLQRLKRPPGFSVALEPPFVIIGDESPERVKAWASTVKWAAKMLRRDFFRQNPDRVLEIWLFKDEASYERHTAMLFGDRPDTPYGYYSAHHNALIMNISTGGGTLVHEMVHPFMEANVPEAPAWLNEGLGSLFEQSAEREGHIVGLLNWRLPGLQKALKKGAVPTLRALTAMDDETFYGDDSGTNYAASRYLLYYLQERELLVPFFKKYLSQRESDPTGYKTLEEMLGHPKMSAFEENWRKYVLALRR